jgi:glycerol dehydrogenase
MTKIPAVREQMLHGEMVAMGVLIQLALEGNLAEAEQVAIFLAKVGLPAHLGQLGLDFEADKEALKGVVEGAMAASILHHEPFEVTPEKLWTAFSAAHRLGLEVTASIGEAAYRELHGE